MTTPNIEEQPLALRLAAWLCEGAWHSMNLGDVELAGAELRRQHALLQSQAERIKSQDSEIAELREMVRRGAINFDEVEDERDALHAKMVPLEKDAARYRWLREADPDEGPSVMESRMNDWGRWFNSHLWQSELDTAIDAAMGITG